MSKPFYSLFDSQNFTSYRLEKLIFGWIGLSFWVSYAGVVLLVLLITENIGLALTLFLAGGFVYSVAYVIVFRLLRDSERALLEDNYAEYFSYDIVTQLADHPEVLTQTALWQAACYSRRGAFLLTAMGYTSHYAAKQGEAYFQGSKEQIEDILAQLMELRDTFEEFYVDGHMILALYQNRQELMPLFLQKADLSQEDFQRILEWESLVYYSYTEPPSLTPEGLRKTESIGRTWTIGYTNALDSITEDISEQVKMDDLPEVVIHKSEMRSVLTHLSRSSRNNVLLLGQVGVGKSQLVRNLAIQIRKVQIEENYDLSRVLKLHTTDLLSGTEDAAKYLLNALSYAERSGNIILVIDDISNVFTQANDEIRNIIGKFMNSGAINVLGLDYPEGYHQGIKQYPGIDHLFETINLSDTSDTETVQVLMMKALRHDKQHKVHVTYQSLKAILSLAKRYLSKGAFPGKAVDILDDSITAALRDGSPFLLESHIRSVMSEKTNVEIIDSQGADKSKLRNLEDNLTSEVVGQEEGVQAIARALKRAQVDMSDQNKPIGTFLLLGPTGVGKTETAKAVTKHYFGTKDRMIRLDMNEFSKEDSVYDILGAPLGSQGGAHEGFLTQQVQDKPFSLVLLDEIEKAHPNVLNTFLQILDEGMLTDNRGVATDFRNTIIIATSNAGALFLRNFLKEHDDFDKGEFKQQLIDTIINEQQFSPEFVNRFTETVVYYPLEKHHITLIAQYMVEDMIDNFEQERGVTLEVEDEAIAYLGEKGYSLDFGARELERTITNTLQTYLADYLLLHNISRGDSIRVRKQDLVEM